MTVTKHAYPVVAVLLAAAVANPMRAAAAGPFDISTRQTVDMPANVVQVLRGEMIDLLGNLQRAQTLSGEGKYFAAADLVDKTLGQSAMGRFGAGVRPSMFMPSAMQTLEQDLHRSATDWSRALRSSDRKQADTALAKLIGQCLGCHQSFQIRRMP